MTEADGVEEGHDLEAPEEDMDDEQTALLHFSKYGEARRALSWQQWTFQEKTSYFLDRIFLVLLITFVIVVIGEFGYKMWYVTNVNKIAEFVSDSVVLLFEWLFKQERQEELVEL